MYWDAQTSITQWEGISVGRTPQQVVELQIDRKRLTGRIPVEFGNLTGLRVLSLASNRLYGSIPPELGALPKLEELDLHGNSLTGPFPLALTNLFKLKILDLHANELEGTIPPEIERMFNLERLSLSKNRFTGFIPPELGNLPKLNHLQLSRNELNGPIPRELGNLPNLIFLQLSQNELSGPIPRELGNLPKLEVLYLWDNQLSGNLPSRLGQLQRLRALIIHTNSFTGEIPKELAKLTRLESFDLSKNQMSGEIPDWLSSLTRLDRVSLHSNQFTGSIPPGLGDLKKLSILYLSHNALVGEIPSTLGNLPMLSDMHLRHNRLTGPIPPELGNLPRLYSLQIDHNNLTGEIPQELGKLSNLTVLHLGYGSLSGSIPVSLGNLSKLQYLQLEHNRLQGTVPTELTQLSNLRCLWLNDNQLHGVVPSELSTLANLEVLDISNSGLTGCLPWFLARNPDLNITHDGLLTCSRPAPATTEGGSISMPITALLYDTPLEGSAIGRISVSNVVNGSVSVEEDTLLFAHDGSETSTASFTYTVIAGHLSVTDQLTIVVKPVNDPPTANGDTEIVDEGQTILIEARSLLRNDLDPDSKDLRVTSVASAVYGRVTLENGIINYQHDGSETTEGSFRYTVSDGIATDSTTVSIMVLPVNDPPLGVSDAKSVVEGSQVSLPASTLLSNDVDPENGDLRITRVGGAFNGRVWLEDSTITYEHDGSETTRGGFTYTVSDGIDGDEVNVVLSVIPSNDSPSGVNDSLAVEEGGTISVPASSLLRNDSDPEGDPVYINSVYGARNGTVLLRGTSITYEHDGSETTVGGFIYTLTDGEISDLAEVTVAVTPLNDPPIAGMESLTIDQGGTVTVETSTLMRNDTDAENDTLAVVAVGSAVNGRVILEGATITYKHDDSDTLTGSFSYTISDGVDAGTSTVEIAVRPVDDLPVTPRPAPTTTPVDDVTTTVQPESTVSPSTPGAQETDGPTSGSVATPSTLGDAKPGESAPALDDGGVNIGLSALVIVLVTAIVGIGAFVVFIRRKRS